MFLFIPNEDTKLKIRFLITGSINTIFGYVCGVIVYNSFYEVEKYIDLDAYLMDIHNKMLISKNEMFKAVDFAIKSYELGLVDLVYLLNYQQQYFEISLRENNFLSDRYMNRIDLILALGGKFEYQ